MGGGKLPIHGISDLITRPTRSADGQSPCRGLIDSNLPKFSGLAHALQVYVAKPPLAPFGFSPKPSPWGVCPSMSLASQRLHCQSAPLIHSRDSFSLRPKSMSRLASPLHSATTHIHRDAALDPLAPLDTLRHFIALIVMKIAICRLLPISFVFVIALGFWLSGSTVSSAEKEAAEIQQAMTPEEFKAAGLEKLSAGELAKLNAWLQGDREKTLKKAEKKAAEHEEKVKQNLIVSRIDGTWNGVVPGEIIRLEDGSKWKLANKDEHYGGFADHPAVAVWKAGFFGWKMRVSGLAEFYVNEVK
jgi:hypothetical protein